MDAESPLGDGKVHITGNERFKVKENKLFYSYNSYNARKSMFVL